MSRALGARTAAAAGYRASFWRVRRVGAAPDFTALEQRLTLGVVVRARRTAP